MNDDATHADPNADPTRREPSPDGASLHGSHSNGTSARRDEPADQPDEGSVAEEPADLAGDPPARGDAISADVHRAPRLPFTIVAIGASAGGLEAFTEFFDAMSPRSGMAFVLVQHLSPKRESLIADILQRHTAMQVLQVDDGMLVEPEHVYVIRPGHTMTLKDGRLRLGEPLTKSGQNRPVDDFFRSLAEEQRERAVCVILSGMGSNGTAGAQAVKVVGGVCIAQEPDSAKFPSMPRHLIEANLADFILKPAEMPEVLQRYANHAFVRDAGPAELIARREGQHVAEILTILRARTRQDFSGYKKPTLVRRIQRRMGLTQHADMRDYARMLRQTPAEVTNLSDDLMIHVTGFFRDPEVWDSLRERVILPLVADRQDQGTIRAWVTACASGEEAYTLAMLFVEAAEAVDKRFDIKIFATDMAERALTHARAGLFAGGIESEISPQRLARFFDKDDARYRVKKEIRELVVFAPQNVLHDPPFSRLDVVTCRNLMIYLEPDMQQKLLSLLHFGLREGGTLVLGNSETIGEQEELFEPIDKRLRIFRRIGRTRHGTLDFPMPQFHARNVPNEGITVGGGDANDLPDARAFSRGSLAQITTKVLLDRYTPPAVVVDRHGRIVFFHGDTERFLDQPRGEPTREVIVLARDFVRGAIRTALSRAVERNEPSTAKDGLIATNDGPQRVEVTAAPLDGRGMAGYFLLTFAHHPVAIAAETADVEASPPSVDVGEELRAAREELQSTIEELQTSNEELKASNEEITSINEELQSTNEELETSKEEMQSLNEELSTVNAQLQSKMEELESTTNDLSSLLSSTDIAVIFLDTQFRIRRFTPPTKKLMDLIPSDLGRPLSDMARRFDDPTLMDDVRAVLNTLVPTATEVASHEDRWYLRRALPYRTADNRIDGIVLTFVDITDRKGGEDALRGSEERVRSQHARTVEILESISDAFYAVDAEFRFTYVNHMAEQLWGRRRDELIGKHFWTEFPEAVGSESHRMHQQVMETRQPAQFETVSPILGRWIDVSLYPEAGGGMSCYFRDVAARKLAEAERRASESRLQTLMESARDFAIIWADPMGQVVAWSAGAAELLGWRAEEVVGQDASLIFTPEDRAAGAVEFELETARRDGRAPDERWHLRKDGTRFWASGVLTRLDPPNPPGGKPLGFVKILRDATDRKRAEEALRLSEERIRVAAEAARMGFWDWDVEANQLTTDRVHNLMFGLPEDQRVCTAEMVLARVHPDDRPLVEAERRKVVERGEEYHLELRAVLPGGEVRWIAAYARPTERGPDGATRRVIGGVIDITDRKRVDAELGTILEAERLARGEAEAASMAKDQFLATLSHELRTPLSAILIWSKILRAEAESAGTLREGVEAIERSAEAQRQLIDDLLDSARIASGKLRIEMRPTALENVVRDAIEAIRPTAEAKGIRLVAEFDDGVGLVRADPDRVRQIVWNLLSNATKFTPEGGEIRLALQRQDRQVSIRIADTGQGIDASFLPSIFERFRQADSSTTRRAGGLGLGLAIVQQLVEMHNGTILAESAGLGRGATFTVRLPMPRLPLPRGKASRGGRRPGEDARREPGTIDGVRVLLVEDQAETRRATRNLLERDGATVDEADTADAAFAAFNANRPDVLVSDIGLPGEDGYSLLTRLRDAGEPDATIVPAIALTAFVHDRDRDRAARAGFAQVVAKPFTIQELIAAIVKVLETPSE